MVQWLRLFQVIFYTRLGVDTQKKIDQKAIDDCIKDNGVECLVRFRSLKKILITIDLLN